MSDSTFESLGYFIESCGLPGETKADHAFPAQHNTIQLACDRWLVIYETRGFRGNDDNRSVVYQVLAYPKASSTDTRPFLSMSAPSLTKASTK